MAALNTHEHMGAVESRGCNIIVGVNRKNIIFCTFHSFKSKPQVEGKARSLGCSVRGDVSAGDRPAVCLCAEIAVTANQQQENRKPKAASEDGTVDSGS